MKQINFSVQIAARANMHNPRVVMCCLSVPNDVTIQNVEQTFKEAFIPALAASINHEDPFNLALSHAITELKREFCAEAFYIQADAIACFIL